MPSYSWASIPARAPAVGGALSRSEQHLLGGRRERPLHPEGAAHLQCADFYLEDGFHIHFVESLELVGDPCQFAAAAYTDRHQRLYRY